MSARRYKRRTKLSRSAERPKIVTPRANVPKTGDGDPTALPTATSTPKVPGTPVAATGPSTMGAGEQTNSGTVKRRSTSATPSRKRGRALAFSEENTQEPDVNATQPTSTMSHRGTADAGASSDSDVERFGGILQKLLKSANVNMPSFQEADTEDHAEELAAKLIKHMRETEQWSTEEQRQQKRVRGLEAVDAVRKAANAIRDQAQTVPLSSPLLRGSHAETAAARISAAALAERAPTANASQSDQQTKEPSYCQGRLPHLIFPTDIEVDTQRDEVHDSTQMPVPTFDGENWAAFKSVFESVAKHYKWSDPIKALRLKCCIKGDARAALGVIESIDWTYDQLVEHMELRHGRYRSRTEVMNELDKLYRKSDQTLTQWRDEVISVANTGTLTDAQWKQYTHYTFLKGLHTYGQMQSWVGEHDKTETLASCYEWAKRYEREVGIPAYTGPASVPVRAPVMVAAHTATAPPVAVEMVTTSDATTSVQMAAHQLEASAANNFADSLAGLQHRLEKLEKALYNNRRSDQSRARCQGWNFNNGNNSSYNGHLPGGAQQGSQQGDHQQE